MLGSRGGHAQHMGLSQGRSGGRTTDSHDGVMDLYAQHTKQVILMPLSMPWSGGEVQAKTGRQNKGGGAAGAGSSGEEGMVCGLVKRSDQGGMALYVHDVCEQYTSYLVCLGSKTPFLAHKLVRGRTVCRTRAIGGAH